MENVGEGYIWNDEFDLFVSLIKCRKHSIWNKYVLRCAVLLLR